MRRLPVIIAIAAIGLSACGDHQQIDTTGNVAGTANVVKGNVLLRSHGCLGCHTIDGAVSSGPTFKGVAGRNVQLDNGTSVIADDNYLRQSINQPSAETVMGFPKGLMATSINQRKKLTPAEVNDVVAYLDTLK